MTVTDGLFTRRSGYGAHAPNRAASNQAAYHCRTRKGIPMKKEASAKKSKLWIVIVAILVLLLAAGGGVLAFVLGGQGEETPAATVSGPRADLYWNIDREFYTANSQTGLSTREADENGQFKMKFAYNGEIVELVIIDKKLVNIIHCKNPRCITTAESQLDSIFFLSNAEKHTYRCAYCEAEENRKKF